MTRIRASKPSSGEDHRQDAKDARRRSNADRISHLAALASWRFSLLLVLAACASAPPQVVAPSGEPPPRRPDAVVVEPPEAIPPPAARAEAGGVVTLREPLASDAIRDVVEALTDAWEKQSLEALVALLTSDAGFIEARGRGRGPLVESWRQRLHAHEYSRLAGVELVRLDRIERWTYDELGSSDAPARPADMRADELYVRVPIEVTHLGSEKLFEDVVVLLLRREEGRFRIAAYGEIGGS